MKIKMLVPAALLMLAAYSTNAQTKTTFGIRAGVNFQNLNGKDIEGDKLNYKLKTGFNVGVNAEIPVAKDYYLQPGVLLSTKGAKYADESGHINISYIEIPVNFVYKPVLGAGRMLLGFGPYAAFGVGGKEKNDEGVERDIKFQNKVTLSEIATDGGPYFKRFDAGANFLAGYEFSSRFSAQLNAQLGLVNIKPQIEGTNDKSKVNNTGFGVSLGYRL
jgi:hypothetical protein